MRKSVHIAVLAIATVGLLLLLLVPHHHHRGMVCLVMSHCATDNADNDRHTGHSDDGSKCFAFSSRAVTVDKAHASDHGEPLFFPLVALYTCSEVVVSTLLSDTLSIQPSPHYPDDLATLSLGLRAPPSLCVAA